MWLQVAVVGLFQVTGYYALFLLHVYRQPLRTRTACSWNTIFFETEPNLLPLYDDAVVVLILWEKC